MEKIVSFYDTKPYDRVFFEKRKEKYGIEINFHETKLNEKTAVLSKGSDAVVAFVNDDLSEKTLETLYSLGIRVIAMRCAGYNNIDLKYAYGKIHIMRVPAYSPYAVAEFTMGMLLTLNRKLHRAYNRTREHNFSLNGLNGFDLRGKNIGVVGTGKIGRTFMEVCSGFKMRILAYDPYPIPDSDIEYVTFEKLCEESDIISLHCPLTKESYHMINKESIQKMKDGVFLLNTSRGALIDSEDLMEGIRQKKIGAAALDVYEEETEFFYEDFSGQIINDTILTGLISMPNVLVTSHQAFFTNEALENIAETTLQNLSDYFQEKTLINEVCYHCAKDQNACHKQQNKSCF